MNNLIAIGIAALILSMAPIAPASAKPMTITERQEVLDKKIAAGEKSGELTKKEADKLRDKMSDIREKIEKRKAKNGGKLSYKDEGDVEEDLNGVSVSIHKKSLEKRVESK